MRHNSWRIFKGNFNLMIFFILYNNFKYQFPLNWRISYTMFYLELPRWLKWWGIRLPMQETRSSIPGLRRSLRRKWQPTPVFLPGEFHQNHRWQNKEYWNFHGQRSLVGYSPWGHKKLDATEHHVLHTKFVYRTLFCKMKMCIYTQE